MPSKPDDPSSDEAQRIEFKKALRRVRRKARERQGEIKELNITAMMDMMTIILVFLLKSWSSSNTTIEMNTSMTPPTSTTQLHPEDTLTITVSQKAHPGGRQGGRRSSRAPRPRRAARVRSAASGSRSPAGSRKATPTTATSSPRCYDRLQKEVDKLEYIAKYNPRAPFNGRVTIICRSLGAVPAA